MRNNYICQVPYLSSNIAYNNDFWYTIVKWWYLQVFFSFFFFLVFWAVSGAKGQKIAQNDKTFCLSCSISQESFVIWLSFMVHLCEIMIFPGLFFIFSKFWFSGLLAVERAKNGPKWEKIISVLLHISRNIHYMIFIYGTHV